MDKSNYQNILSLARTKKDEQKVMMILNEAYPTKNFSVPDPYNGKNDGFENVYKMLDDACNIIAKNLELC